jgi:plastocyanin
VDIVKKQWVLTSLAAGAVVAAVTMGGRSTIVAAGTGTIKGHVKVIGKVPGNPVIRMGMDPMCSRLYAGKRAVDEIAVVAADGSVANVFVKLDGSFPSAPVPKEPVVIDQKGCLYTPRVVGARVGQVLRIQNSDSLLHNVHSITTGTNSFNVGQPLAGMKYDFRLKDEEVLKLKCDVHRWMVAYVGIVNHPYFAVSAADGTFTIGNVPAGKYTIRAWHETFGASTQTVEVKAGGTATATFTYTVSEKPQH